MPIQLSLFICCCYYYLPSSRLNGIIDMFNIRDNFLSQGSPPATSTLHHLNPPALKFSVLFLLLKPEKRRKCQLNDIISKLLLLIKTQKSLSKSQSWMQSFMHLSGFTDPNKEADLHPLSFKVRKESDVFLMNQHREYKLLCGTKYPQIPLRRQTLMRMTLCFFDDIR